MTEFLTFNLNTAYNEIKEQAEREGITSNEAWDSLVENYINEKVGIGELDSDQDTQGMIDDLKGRFEVYKENINIR